MYYFRGVPIDALVSVVLILGIILLYYVGRPISKRIKRDYHRNDDGWWGIMLGLVAFAWAARVYPVVLGEESLNLGGGLYAGLLVALFLNPANLWSVPVGKTGILYLKWSPFGSAAWVDTTGKLSGYKLTVYKQGVHFCVRLFYSPVLGPIFTTPINDMTYVRANVGGTKRIGWKFGAYKRSFGMFTNLARFIRGGGQFGLQAQPLQPGRTFAMHWAGFNMITRQEVIGLCPEPHLQVRQMRGEKTTPQDLGIEDARFNLTVISAGEENSQENPPMMGLVTMEDGPRSRQQYQLFRFKDQATDADGYSVFQRIADEAIGDRPIQTGGFIKIRVQRRTAGQTVAEEKNLDQPDIFKYGFDFEKGLCARLWDIFTTPQFNRHDSYQNTEPFYDDASGAGQGPMFDPIGPGTYYISLFVFSVNVVRQPYVATGKAMYVIGGDGLKSEDITHEWFESVRMVRPGSLGAFYSVPGAGYHIFHTGYFNYVIGEASFLSSFFDPNRVSPHGMDSNGNIYGLINTTSQDGLEPKLNIDVTHITPEEFWPIVGASFTTQQRFFDMYLAPRLMDSTREAMAKFPTVTLVTDRPQVSDAIFERFAEWLAKKFVVLDEVLIQGYEGIDRYLAVRADKTIAEESMATIEAKTQMALKDQERQRQEGIASEQKNLAIAKVRAETAGYDRKAIATQGKAIKDLMDAGLTEAAAKLGQEMALANGVGFLAKVLPPDQLVAFLAIRTQSEHGLKFLPEVMGGGDLTALGGQAMQFLQDARRERGGGGRQPQPPTPATTPAANAA